MIKLKYKFVNKLTQYISKMSQTDKIKRIDKKKLDAQIAEITHNRKYKEVVSNQKILASKLSHNRRHKEYGKDAYGEYDISHSSTSSECSYPEESCSGSGRITRIMRTDTTHQTRLERLLPKELRRRKFCKLTKPIMEQRTKYYKKIEKKPEDYVSEKGIRTFLLDVFIKKQKKDSDKEVKNATKKNNDLALEYPWLPFLAWREAKSRKRADIIREKYFETAAEPNEYGDQLPDRALQMARFCSWYTNVRKEQHVPSNKDIAPYYGILLDDD